MSLEESMPYIVGFVVWVIYEIGKSRGKKIERAKQDDLMKSLTIKKLSEDNK
ncbi:TPA: hypothetical protein RQN22_001827 [Aeromonas dhakensis]|nr:hypothetical protein [Aeromonas dhakensis]